MNTRKISFSKATQGRTVKLKDLMGSGDRIMLFTLPFLVVGLILNILKPYLFSVGGPPTGLKILSTIILIPGITIWLWSIILILTQVPQKKLITSGPYSFVKHPLYTSVALLVLPWIGILLNSWLGVLLGATLYVASRIYSPAEERTLSKVFGVTWDTYCQTVKLPWL